jgi:hypothetical protein
VDRQAAGCFEPYLRIVDFNQQRVGLWPFVDWQERAFSEGHLEEAFIEEASDQSETCTDGEIFRGMVLQVSTPRIGPGRGALEAVRPEDQAGTLEGWPRSCIGEEICSTGRIRNGQRETQVEDFLSL